MKEKMLSKLERDRAIGQVTGLQSTLKNLENIGKDVRVPDTRILRECMFQELGPSQRSLVEARIQEDILKDIGNQTQDSKRHPD
ncbi:sperm-associated antigen 16 protein-like, partial [Saccoglossus kowalevskii]|uniref:Sperm-associated antigen 16 protein-like n=1 Tax=Saccoglossus kowalevskii TaxID=10224 RepID=A0ABM0MPZ6_SACKO